MFSGGLATVADAIAAHGTDGDATSHRIAGRALEILADIAEGEHA
jgi:hypothetical protein